MNVHSGKVHSGKVHSAKGSSEDSQREGGEQLGTISASQVLSAMKAARVWDVSDASTAAGVTLAQISEESPVLVVFLRHFGCTFCREALSDLSKVRSQIQERGVRIVVVHMVGPEDAREHLRRYDLGVNQNVGQISDPERRLYQALELARGTLRQLFGARVVWRGFVAGVLKGHWLGRLAGDGMQLSGAFLVRKGKIVRAYRHATAADRVDYCEVAGVEGRGHR